MLHKAPSYSGGPNPDTGQVTVIGELRDGRRSVEDLKRYRDAGASRLVVYRQNTRQEVVTRSVLIVERAQRV
jgi:hypothetical protein